MDAMADADGAVCSSRDRVGAGGSGPEPATCSLSPEQGSPGQLAHPEGHGGARGFSLGNRPPLTGVRAVCVSLVVIFHSNFKTLPGSWVALGVFFVLSGFLITVMLAGEREQTGRISLTSFYLRRGARLVPPLLMVAALLGLYAAIVPVASAGSRLWGDAAAALFYFSDYRSAFNHEPVLGFMAQCWSLAVEEQFYLIWSIVIVAALKARTRTLAYVLVSTGIAVCAANRMWIVFSAPHWDSVVAGRVYYAFDTRADALFLGCLLGLVATGGFLDAWRSWAKRALTGLAIVSGAVMIWILVNVGVAPRSQPLVWLPVSEVASSIIITYLVVKPRGLGSRLLGWRPLVLIGNMSYTIYLVHWPVYVAISPFTVTWSYWTTELARLAIIVPFSVASWYLVEHPLMRWRRKALTTSPLPTTELDPSGAFGAEPSKADRVLGRQRAGRSRSGSTRVASAVE